MISWVCNEIIMKIKNYCEKKRGIFSICLAVSVLIILIFCMSLGLAASPGGPSNLNITSNETRAATPSQVINVSGGYIATLNITANIQNPRWKGMVGWVNGKFSLDDQSGSTLFDWSLATITGDVFATRNSTTVRWANIQCANVTVLETENLRMNHSNYNDNLTKTFSNRTHSTFDVGGVSIDLDSCPTAHPYVNNATGLTFQETVLFDGATDAEVGAVVYSALINDNQVGFDGQVYDFEMVIPENGLATWSGQTPYYLYVELG